MDKLIQLFVEEMVDKLKRSVMFDEETKVINDLRSDLQNTNIGDYSPLFKFNVEEVFRTYRVIVSTKHKAEIPIAFLYRPLEFIDKNTFGGYDITNNFIWVSMYQLANFADKYEGLKTLAINFFEHPNILSVLHHEVAHFNFKNTFPSEDEYMKFRDKDYQDKSQSEEEYNSFLQEFLSYIKCEKIYLDTKADLENFFKERSGNKHILNLYLNLKQYKDQERVVNDLLTLARDYEFEEKYGVKQKTPEELKELEDDKQYLLTGEAKKRADARLKELFTTGIKHYIYMEDLPRIRAEYEELKKLSDEMKKHK